MTQKIFLTVNQVAVMLGIAEKTVRKYIWLRSIPYVKIGGHVRFDQDKILAWLEEREVPTLAEIRTNKNERRTR